jgi:PAS domain S-box-containing protein
MQNNTGLSAPRLFRRIAAFMAKPLPAGLLAAFLTLAATGSVSYYSYTVRKQDERRQVMTAAEDARDALRTALGHGLSATQTVGLGVSEGLFPARFDSIIPRLFSSYTSIDAIELAPNGIVSHVYPPEPNRRALGFNILADPVQRDEAALAVRSRQLIFAGPLELVQGGLGVVGRGPVFIRQRGVETFWGFTIVIIRIETLVSAAHLNDLEEQGFRFRLSRRDPISNTMICFYNAGQVLDQPLTLDVAVPNGAWEIAIAPVRGWRAGVRTFPMVVISVVLSLLGGLFTWFMRRQPERLKELVEIRAAELFRSESRFASLIEGAPLGIMIMRDGAILYANPLFYTMLGHPEGMDLVGREFDEYLRPVPSALTHSQTAGAAARTGDHTYEVLRADGIVRFVEMSRTPVELQDGAAEVAFITDITERRQAERLISESLTEKVTLLKEIHHRVKNNLQVISSLLSLQAGQLDDPRAKEAFEASNRRVISMAMVHEKLYRSGHMSQIDFAQYLSAVAMDLAHAFYSPGVGVKVEAQEIMLSLDLAVPCGLIANELIVNSLKHGFPDGREGVIAASILRRPDGMIEMAIADNGVGLPPGLDVEGLSSMGMTTVRTLVGQIGGTLTVGAGPGSRMSVVFPA